MTKSRLGRFVADRFNLPKEVAEQAVDAVFSAVTKALAGGKRVVVRGFGSFEVRARKARLGRNPKTGEPVEVPAKRTPFFRVGKELRERVASTGRK
jgi:integration host factor subunit beta